MSPARSTSATQGRIDALRAAGTTPTMLRIAIGNEDPRNLIVHRIYAAEPAIDPVRPGFSVGFPRPDAVDALYRDVPPLRGNRGCR